MSRRLLAVLCPLVVALVCAQITFAQPAPPPPGGAGEPAPRRVGPQGQARGQGQGMQRRAPVTIEQIVKDLALTEEQTPQVRQAWDAYNQALRNWRDENQGKMRELFGQMRQANEAGDEAKLAELAKEFAKINQARLKPRDDMFTQLTEVLSAEQMEKLKDLVIPWRMQIKAALAEMKLTDEQKAKAAKIINEYKEGQEPGLGMGRRTGAAQAVAEQIVTEVILTADQRTALKKIEGEDPLLRKVQQLDLTDAQKDQIQKIADAMRSRGGRRQQPAAGPQTRRARQGRPGGGRNAPTEAEPAPTD